MNEAKRPTGFVSLKSIRQGPPDPKAALAELRQIYFCTTKNTIDDDFDHAIELLKSLPSEEEREKAVVYMEGIAQMRKEWAVAREGRSRTERTGQTGSHGETGKRRRTGNNKK